jgi:hypothetical protein
VLGGSRCLRMTRRVISQDIKANRNVEQWPRDRAVPGFFPLLQLLTVAESEA